MMIDIFLRLLNYKTYSYDQRAAYKMAIKLILDKYYL